MSRGRLLYLVVLWLVAGVVIGVLLTLVATEANAQPIEPLDVDLPITTIIKGDPGSVHLVGTIDAQPGAACVAELREFRNRQSTHDGNDILVGPVVFTNVESGTFEAAGLTFTATGPIEVFVRLGPERIFSAGFLLEVTCNPSTTTTSTASLTTSTVPNTPTTTSAVPVDATTPTLPNPKGVNAGFGEPSEGSQLCGGSWQCWTWVGVVWIAGALLAWAFIYGATRKDGR